MPAFNKFNSFAALANAIVNLGSDTVKCMLTNTAPVATNTTYASISGNELANGNGYTTGGMACTLVSSSQSGGTYKAIFSMANPSLTATGSVGPFRYAVIYDVTTGILIGWWDYGSSLTLSATNTFTIALDGTNGVFQVA